MSRLSTRIPHRSPRLTALAGAALLCLSLGAAAQGTATAPGKAPATGTAAASLDRADKAFMEKAAMGGMVEVEMGRLAQQKGTSQQVKDFGARMVQDHGAANNELMQLASKKGLQMPSDAGSAHKRDVQKLSGLSGAQFDREYMAHMVKDHRKDVSDFEKASKSAKDSDVKAFAAKTLPVLQEHLKLAQTTQDAVKAAK